MRAKDTKTILNTSAPLQPIVPELNHVVYEALDNFAPDIAPTDSEIEEVRQ